MVLPHMRKVGAPLFLYSNSPASDQVHHPKYSKMIARRAEELQIPCEVWGGRQE